MLGDVTHVFMWVKFVCDMFWELVLAVVQSPINGSLSCGGSDVTPSLAVLGLPHSNPDIIKS